MSSVTSLGFAADGLYIMLFIYVIAWMRVCKEGGSSEMRWTVHISGVFQNVAGIWDSSEF